jgi:hypothetical protein
MGCFSKWSIGGCGCTSAPCCTAPCPLPQDALTLTTTYNGGGTATIAYQGNCVWFGCITTGSGAGIQYIQVRITYSSGCTLFEFLGNNGTNCSGVFGGGGWYYMNPSGCGSTVAPTGLVLQSSSTCNPLSIVLKDTLQNTLWTISYSGTVDDSSCNCNSCLPCALPATILHASINLGAFSPAYTGSGPLTYTTGTTGGVPYCKWGPNCISLSNGSSTRSAKVTIYCSATCSYYRCDLYLNANCTGTPGSTLFYDDPTSCSGISSLSPNGTYTLVSYTCSPLNLYFSYGAPGNPSLGDQLTLTQ